MDRHTQHNLWTAPSGENENVKVYKLVRFLMVTDIARDKFEYAKRNIEFWNSVVTWYLGEVAVHLHIRRFINLIEEVTDPLITQDLSIAGPPKFTDHVPKIRRDGRNTTAHLVRLVNDATLYPYVRFLEEEDLSYLFENIFPSVRKSLFKKNRTVACQFYKELRAIMKTSPKRVRTGDAEIASMITLASLADSQDIPRGSIGSPSRKIEITPLGELIFDMLEASPTPISTVNICVNGAAPSPKRNY